MAWNMKKERLPQTNNGEGAFVRKAISASRSQNARIWRWIPPHAIDTPSLLFISLPYIHQRKLTAIRFVKSYSSELSSLL